MSRPIRLSARDLAGPLPATVRAAIDAGTPAPRRKYGNTRVEYDGYTFDSKLERDTYIELRLQERAGIIAELEVQPRYDFFETDHATGKPKLVTYYKADFRYRIVATGEREVIDCKTWTSKTRAYGIKKRWMKIRYGISIIEVTSVHERK